MTARSEPDAVNDAEVMRLWRECDLPEYFLGNAGTNHRLVAFAKAYSSSRIEEVRKEGWQPIETAPKQKVILLWALTDTETGNWKMASGHWCPGYRDEPGEWRWDGHRLKSYDVQPTHWQPLPTPPSLSSLPLKG